MSLFVRRVLWTTFVSFVTILGSPILLGVADGGDEMTPSQQTCEHITDV